MKLIRAQVVEVNYIKKLRYTYLNKGFGNSTWRNNQKYKGELKQQASTDSVLTTYTNITRENITKDMW